MSPVSGERYSFNTQPPEGGWGQAGFASYRCACFNTQPPEGGWTQFGANIIQGLWFQHTAARRRLGNEFNR